MAGPRLPSIVLASVALAAGCASNEGPYPSVPPTNATVTRVLMQAPAALAAAPAPVDTSAAGGAPVALETSKAGKRGRARNDKATPNAQKASPSAARTDASAGKPGATAVASGARSGGGTRGTPSSALQYRYLVELDRGGLRAFDFADDQKLRAGDRVFVTDGGTLSLK